MDHNKSLTLLSDTFAKMATATTQQLPSSIRRVVTRSQTLTARKARSLFPFLHLPAEIRNLIYHFAIDITAAQKLIDRYYQLCKGVDDLQTVGAPIVWSKPPTILLINRQIHAEATFVLKKRGLVFDHGLLDLADITEFVPKGLLRTVSSITVTDAGHGLFPRNIAMHSWIGYMTLIEQLGDVLSQGHNLNNLTINLADDDLVPHVTACWNAAYYCFYRDSLRRALNSLRAVHSIPCITLHGIPDDFARELKAHMESPPRTLLDLPPELRNVIWSHCGDWSDITQQLFRTMANWTDRSKRIPYAKRSTPTILLLNKQITAEALPILRKKPLTFIGPSDYGMQPQHPFPNITRLLNRETLLNVQHLVIKLENHEWLWSLVDVLPILATSCNLKTFALSLRDICKVYSLIDMPHQYPDRLLNDLLAALTKFRGLENVTFTGDLPACYTVPLAQIMQSPKSAAQLPKLQALKGDGSTVDIE